MEFLKDYILKKTTDDEYLTFIQASQRFPAFSEGSLRWHRYKNTRDFNKCVRNVGRKCLISVKEFLEWIEINS